MKPTVGLHPGAHDHPQIDGGCLRAGREVHGGLRQNWRRSGGVPPAKPQQRLHRWPPVPQENHGETIRQRGGRGGAETGRFEQLAQTGDLPGRGAAKGFGDTLREEGGIGENGWPPRRRDIPALGGAPEHELGAPSTQIAAGKLNDRLIIDGQHATRSIPRREHLSRQGRANAFVLGACEPRQNAKRDRRRDPASAIRQFSTKRRRTLAEVRCPAFDRLHHILGFRVRSENHFQDPQTRVQPQLDVACDVRDMRFSQEIDELAVPRPVEKLRRRLSGAPASRQCPHRQELGRANRRHLTNESRRLARQRHGSRGGRRSRAAGASLRVAQPRRQGADNRLKVARFHRTGQHEREIFSAIIFGGVSAGVLEAQGTSTFDRPARTSRVWMTGWKCRPFDVSPVDAIKPPRSGIVNAESLQFGRERCLVDARQRRRQARRLDIEKVGQALARDDGSKCRRVPERLPRHFSCSHLDQALAALGRPVPRVHRAIRQPLYQLRQPTLSVGVGGGTSGQHERKGDDG